MLGRKLLVFILITSCNSSAKSTPLWKGSKFTTAQRDQAILKGLDFIYQSTLLGDNFSEYSSDYLWCFFSIAKSSSNPQLSKRAFKLGQQLAIRWKNQTTNNFNNLDVDDISELAMGLDTSEEFGIFYPKLRTKLEKKIPKFSTMDYLLFDPKTEPPPTKALELTGKEACIALGIIPTKKPCPMFKSKINDLEIWYNALITTYFGDRFGVPFGARFKDLMQWRSKLYPYPSLQQLGEEEYYEQVYLITHIVYTHNHYGQLRLNPKDFPNEYKFLRNNFQQILHDDDPETFAEFVDTLKSFGDEPKDNPHMAKAIEAILKSQNKDGSWGDEQAEDIYDRYHPTWTAIDALRDYKFQNKILKR